MRRAAFEAWQRMQAASWSTHGSPTAGLASNTSQCWRPACWGPARLQQAAGLRIHARQALPAHIPGRSKHVRPRRGPLARVLAAAGKAAGLTLVAVPTAGVAALVVAGRSSDVEAVEILRSLPRTAAAAWWGLGSAMRYKALAARHKGDLQSAAYQAELAAAHLAEAKRLLALCQSNGGLYIKAGQLAVSASRQLPQQYTAALASLQDRVPPRPFAAIKDHLERELGQPLAEVFSEFSETATAAASLAQVHQARLKDGGQRVAVKVQYPRLEAAVYADLSTMTTLSGVAAWLFPQSDLTWLFDELGRKIRYELDFRHEAENSQRFAALMAARPDVAVPGVYPRWSGQRLLTMDWVEGCRVSDRSCLLEAGMSPREVSVLLLDVFAESQYECGFIHDDPHPGNILVRPRDEPQGWLARWWSGGRARPQLVLLDHGVYVSLPEDLRRAFCQLWGAILLGDSETAREAAGLVGGARAAKILPEILRPRDWQKVSKEERRRVVRESGIESFQDFAKVLSEAPRPLLETLRVLTVVRNTASGLGATISDRMRINATHAWRGMSKGGQPAGQLQYLGAFSSRVQRWRLALRLALLRLAFWLGSLVDDLMHPGVEVA